jgi:hypothetical protein
MVGGVGLRDYRDIGPSVMHRDCRAVKAAPMKLFVFSNDARVLICFLNGSPSTLIGAIDRDLSVLSRFDSGKPAIENYYVR